MGSINWKEAKLPKTLNCHWSDLCLAESTVVLSVQNFFVKWNKSKTIQGAAGNLTYHCTSFMYVSLVLCMYAKEDLTFDFWKDYFLNMVYSCGIINNDMRRV